MTQVTGFVDFRGVPLRSFMMDEAKETGSGRASEDVKLFIELEQAQRKNLNSLEKATSQIVPNRVQLSERCIPLPHAVRCFASPSHTVSAVSSRLSPPQRHICLRRADATQTLPSCPYCCPKLPIPLSTTPTARSGCQKPDHTRATKKWSIPRVNIALFALSLPSTPF